MAPQTRIERVYVIGGIFLGASVYAYMVGAVCGIVAAMDPDESDFYGAMDTCAADLLRVLFSKLRAAAQSQRLGMHTTGWHGLL